MISTTYLTIALGALLQATTASAIIVPINVGGEWSAPVSDDHLFRGFKQNIEEGQNAFKDKVFKGNTAHSTIAKHYVVSHVVTDLSDVKSTTGIEGEVGVSYGPMLSGEGAVSFLEKNLSTENSVTVMYTRRSEAIAKSVLVDDDLAFSDEALVIARDSIDEIYEIYGTKFVDQIIYGAQLNVAFTITSREKINASEIKAELEATIGFGIFEGSFAGRFEKSENEEQAELQMTIEVKAIGVQKVDVPLNPTFDQTIQIVQDFNDEYNSIIDSLGDHPSTEQEQNVINQLSPIAFSLSSIADYQPKLDGATAAVLDRKMERLRDTMYDTLLWMAKLEQSLDITYTKYGESPRLEVELYEPFEREVLYYLDEELQQKLNECLAYRRLPLREIIEATVPKRFDDSLLKGFVGKAYIASPLTIGDRTFEGIYYEGYGLPTDEGTFIPWLSGTAFLDSDEVIVSDRIRVAAGNTPAELQERLEVAVGLLGKLNDGETCNAHNDCQSNLCMANICLRDDGDICEENNHCASGRCDPDNLVCLRLRFVGESCVVNEECETDLCHNGICLIKTSDPCDNDEDCQTGRCDGDLGDRKCYATKDTGSSCNEHTDCASGFCIRDTCSDRSPGSPCNKDIDCDSDICIDAVCRAGVAGDPCDFDSDCDNRRCVQDQCRAGANKDVCRRDSDCNSDFCDNGRCYGDSKASNVEKGARWSGEFSEENGGRSADVGPIIGVWISDNWGDNKKVEQAASSSCKGSGGKWTSWFSEEHNNFIGCARNEYVGQIQCKKSKCDEIRLKCVRMHDRCSYRGDSKHSSIQNNQSWSGNQQFLWEVKCEDRFCGRMRLGYRNVVDH